jgi:AraC-like DNA-binding protein
LADLIECYFHPSEQPGYQAGCKAFFLGALYHLARHFQPSENLRAEFIRQRQRSWRFQKLFDFVRENFAEKITIDQAAALTHMSRPQFMKQFKKIAGVTFVAYLNHVRLARAYQLLKESTASIAEIAAQTGFSDQSYFDRQFKKAFGHPPHRLRQLPPPR